MPESVPIRACLPQDLDEIAVLQHVPGHRAFQNRCDILADSGKDSPVLSAPPYHGIQPVGGILILKQQINFIQIVHGGTADFPVFYDFIPDMLQNDHHGKVFQPLSHIPDLEDHQPVGDLHVGGMTEDGQ